MRSGRQTFGLGIVVGVALGTAILLVVFFINSLAPGAIAMGALPPATASLAIQSSPTAVSSPPPTATFTPIAPPATSNIAAGFVLSPTPDPLGLLISAGELAFSGPLPPEQQAVLYRASLKYAQTSVADSKRIAKEINGVGYGDPSNICGPLAIAILRDAGVVGPEIVPHDYWLLDPTKVPDKRLIEAAFPPEHFTHETFSTQLNKVDWAAAPLAPGDFLFIWHGSWGNFDHMLVVNRVDRLGRAYSVTNFGSDEGYIIAETMLYDPADAAAGIFHTWTQQRDAPLGSTGFGGFEIWRSRSD